MSEGAEESVDVSVIVAVRNGVATLAQCIDSVLAQTCCAVELIIVDALSDDGTQEIVESYGAAIATSIREADRGIYDAWNKALPVARGDWCAFLGADDYYMHDKSVATLLRCASESTVAPVFVYGGVLRTGGVEDFVAHPDPPDLIAHLRSGKMLPHQGVLHHLAVLRSVGGFDASFRIMGDLDAVLKLARLGAVRRCDDVVTVMRIGGVSSAWEARKTAARERFRIVREERGPLIARIHRIRTRILQMIGRAFERGLLMVLSERAAIALILRARRATGRPPKML